MTEHAIETDSLTKKFGKFTAVDSISFTVERGSIFGFLGPNGAGKSTTIRMLCTLSRPSGGRANVAGFDILRQDSRVRKHIGLVSEKMIMYDELTARENLLLFGRLYDIPRKQLNRRVDELLGVVRMEKWARTRIKTFSTGMKQKINVIRAMINHPEILFLDEPTLGLDPQSTAEIRELIKKINREDGTTMILTTHMMTEADILCDRIGIIDRGKLVAIDTSANLKKIVSGTSTSLFEFEVPNLSTAMLSSLEKLGSVDSVVHMDNTHFKVRSGKGDGLNSILAAITDRGGKIRTVQTIEPTLEDVFLHITGREVRENVDTHTHSRGMGGHGPGARRVTAGRGR